MAKLVPLSDVASLITKGTTPKTMGRAYVSVGVPFLRAEDINGSAVDWMSARHHIDADTNGLLARSRLRPGDVLITIAGTIGRVGYVPVGSPEMNCNQAVSLVRLDTSRALPSYICHVLKSAAAFENITQQKTTATISNISLAQVGAIRVPLPSLSEQRRIVDILDRAASIQKLRRQAEAKAQEIIPALFVDMFGDPATNPREWPVKQLEDVADIGSGATKGRKLAGKQAVLVPYLRVANVQDGFLSLNEIKEIEIQETEREKYGLRVGDLVMTEGGDLDKLGRGFIWEGQLPYCAHQNHVFRVRVNGELLDPYFLSHLIQSWHGKSYFLHVAKRTTGIASINKTQLGRLPVWLPPLSMQQEFASQVSDLSAMIARQKQGTACVASLQSALAERVLANV